MLIEHVFGHVTSIVTPRKTDGAEQDMVIARKGLIVKFHLTAISVFANGAIGFEPLVAVFALMDGVLVIRITDDPLPPGVIVEVDDIHRMVRRQSCDQPSPELPWVIMIVSHLAVAVHLDVIDKVGWTFENSGEDVGPWSPDGGILVVYDDGPTRAAVWDVEAISSSDPRGRSHWAGIGGSHEWSGTTVIAVLHSRRPTRNPVRIEISGLRFAPFLIDRLSGHIALNGHSHFPAVIEKVFASINVSGPLVYSLGAALTRG